MYEGTNPRAFQSMESIGNALVELLQEESFEDVSVTMICAKAGVSRPTFYKNFSDKDDALAFVFDQLFNPLVEQFKAGTIEESTFTLTSVIMAFGHAKQLLRLASKGHLQSVFLERLMEAVRRAMANYADPTWPDDKMDYIYAYYAGALTTLLMYWSTQESPIPLELLTVLCTRLVDGSAWGPAIPRNPDEQLGQNAESPHLQASSAETTPGTAQVDSKLKDLLSGPVPPEEQTRAAMASGAPMPSIEEMLAWRQAQKEKEAAQAPTDTSSADDRPQDNTGSKTEPQP